MVGTSKSEGGFNVSPNDSLSPISVLPVVRSFVCDVLGLDFHPVGVQTTFLCPYYVLESVLI